MTDRLYRKCNGRVESLDISDPMVLQRLAADVGVEWAAAQSDVVKKQLFENTDQAAARGAFGVPAFWVNGRLLWGQDRMHFLGRELGQ